LPCRLATAPPDDRTENEQAEQVRYASSSSLFEQQFCQGKRLAFAASSFRDVIEA
jgi:hypothetical protein